MLMMSRRSATILDVAREAAVSPKTVSRVLNDEPRVKADTRTAVLDAVKRLRYERNSYARGLRAGNSNVYGMIYADSTGGYHMDVLHGVLRKCKEEGFHLIVELLEGRDIVRQLEKFVTQVRLDGAVLMAPLSDDIRLTGVLNDYAVPVIRIAPRTVRPGDLTVGIDDEQAAADIVTHLIDLGHRRIGFIEGTPNMAASEQRLAGYRRALGEHGLDFNPALVQPGQFSFASGEAGGHALLSTDCPPTAIIASNDETAAGVLSAALSAGLRVPSDVSICGFDDSMVAKTVFPHLTTVRQPSQDIGTEAISILQQFRKDVAAGRSVASIRKVLRHEVIARASTAPPPSG